MRGAVIFGRAYAADTAIDAQSEKSGFSMLYLQTSIFIYLQ